MAKHKGWLALGAVAGVLGISYVIYKLVNKKTSKGNTGSGSGNPVSSGNSYVSPTPGGSPLKSDPGFPLRKGSKNNYVKELQSALIRKYGASILPKYHADGDWGSETDAAVKSKLGISSINTYAEFNNIISSLSSGLQPSYLAPPPGTPSVTSYDGLTTLLYGSLN